MFLLVLGKPPRVFSLGKTIAVILFIEIKVRRVAAGRGKEHVSIVQAELRSLLSSMSSCGFRQIPSGKSEFRGIPWNFYGKHLAGASAIWVSFSMEIPTFFQGIPMEMVGIREPPGMIPNGICGIPLEFHWNSNGIPWETAFL